MRHQSTIVVWYILILILILIYIYIYIYLLQALGRRSFSTGLLRVWSSLHAAACIALVARFYWPMQGFALGRSAILGTWPVCGFRPLLLFRSPAVSRPLSTVATLISQRLAFPLLPS